MGMITRDSHALARARDVSGWTRAGSADASRADRARVVAHSAMGGIRGQIDTCSATAGLLGSAGIGAGSARADEICRARDPARPAIVRIRRDVPAGVPTSHHSWRAGAGPARTHAASRANASAASAMADIRKQIDASPVATRQRWRAARRAVSGVADLVGAACDTTATAVSRIRRGVHAIGTALRLSKGTSHGAARIRRLGATVDSVGPRFTDGNGQRLAAAGRRQQRKEQRHAHRHHSSPTPSCPTSVGRPPTAMVSSANFTPGRGVMNSASSDAMIDRGRNRLERRPSPTPPAADHTWPYRPL